MNQTPSFNSVDKALERINHAALTESHRLSLVAVGILSRAGHVGTVLWVPDSHSRLPDWDRVGKQLGRHLEGRASLSLLARLIDVREYFISTFRGKSTSRAWQASSFFELVSQLCEGHAIGHSPTVAAFEDGRPQLRDHHQHFDRSLHLACCHFLSAQSLGRKALGMTAAECCLLYMEAVELLDREVKHPGYLPEAALAIGRRLLCDDQWNVVDGHCQLLFRPACEAMIRSIQIAVLESLAYTV